MTARAAIKPQIIQCRLWIVLDINLLVLAADHLIISWDIRIKHEVPNIKLPMPKSQISHLPLNNLRQITYPLYVIFFSSLILE